METCSVCIKLSGRQRRASKKLKMPAESNRFTIHENIDEDGKIICPAFTVPLLDFGIEADDLVNLEFDASCPSSVIAAKKKWKKLYEVILEKGDVIPLRQMMIKKKHEEQVFNKM